MGCGFLNPTFASAGLDTTYQGRAPLDDDRRWRPYWNYERRGPTALLDRIGWASLWPTGGTMGKDSATPMGHLGGDYDSGGVYFETPLAGYGTQTCKFIKGTVLDSNSAPVANAIVQGFVTATDEFVGEVTAAADGTYALPTNNLSTTEHYLTAYKVGSPSVAGTTVNTLLPTNIDA